MRLMTYSGISASEPGFPACNQHSLLCPESLIPRWPRGMKDFHLSVGSAAWLAGKGLR